MITVNRMDFMAWTMGELMDRDSSGRVVIGDNINHEKAEAAMLNGETIAMVNKNKQVVSYMHLTEEGFVEFQEDQS
jgi:hypothetical protein